MYLGYTTTRKVNSGKECQLRCFCRKFGDDLVRMVGNAVVVLVVFDTEEYAGNTVIQEWCLIAPLKPVWMGIADDGQPNLLVCFVDGECYSRSIRCPFQEDRVGLPTADHVKVDQGPNVAQREWWILDKVL